MVSIIKASGDIEPFDEIKVINSIRRAGIPQHLQEQVLAHVKTKLYDRIPSSEIYHHVVEFLDRSDQPFAKSRYSLKQAIMLLGPTGYPFEDFVAKVLEADGYSTEVRQILQGQCVMHEVDVVANKNNETVMVEAKFHNNPGTRSDVHVALYTKSRYEDVKDKYQLNQAWIVTNTKTTTDANAYADCVGMKVMSWSYPDTGSLRDRIEKNNLHPITILSSITPSQKIKLLENHITLCKELHDDLSKLDVLDLPHQKKEQVKAELSFIFSSP